VEGYSTNLQRLIDAKIVIFPEELPPGDVAIIDSLTSLEIEQLIALRTKLGWGFIDRHARPSASFIF
jgi:hypothetical protein